MSSALSTLPPAMRRRGALGLGAFAALFGVVGVLAIVNGHLALTVLGVLVLAAGVVLALAGWGMWHSVAVEAAERELDAEVARAIAEHGLTCGCGHDHDPDEMRVTTKAGDNTASSADGTAGGTASSADEACGHDGSGADCAHDCTDCVLSSLRR